MSETVWFRQLNWLSWSTLILGVALGFSASYFFVLSETSNVVADLERRINATELERRETEMSAFRAERIVSQVSDEVREMSDALAEIEHKVQESIGELKALGTESQFANEVSAARIQELLNRIRQLEQELTKSANDPNNR